MLHQSNTWREATQEKEEDLNSVSKELSVVAVTDNASSQDVKIATEQEQQAMNLDAQEFSFVNVSENTPSQSNKEKNIEDRNISCISHITKQESFSGTFKRHVSKECHEGFEKVDLFGGNAVSHMEAKFFSCPECPYRTIDKAALSKHITKHVKGKLYACPYCPACHSLEQQHISHQKQAHPKMKVIINDSASLGVRMTDHRKHKISDKPSQEDLISSPPSKVRRYSGPISSSFPAVPVYENIRISPSPSPTAKVLNSPKSSASSSPSSEVHEFTITSPSPPPELPRSTRSNFPSSPPSKGQRISGVILSSPTQNLAKNSKSSTSSPPPQTEQRVCESSLSPSPPPKLPKKSTSRSVSSPSKYIKTRRMCLSPSPPLELLRSMSTSSSSSNQSPEYSPTPSPTPLKSLRTTRSSTLADSLRRRSREK